MSNANFGGLTAWEDRYKRELTRELRSKGLTVSNRDHDSTRVCYGVEGDIRRGSPVQGAAESIEITAGEVEATVVQGLVCTLGDPLDETAQEREDARFHISFTYQLVK